MIAAATTAAAPTPAPAAAAAVAAATATSETAELRGEMPLDDSGMVCAAQPEKRGATFQPLPKRNQK